MNELSVHRAIDKLGRLIFELEASPEARQAGDVSKLALEMWENEACIVATFTGRSPLRIAVDYEHLAKYPPLMSLGDFVAELRQLYLLLNALPDKDHYRLAGVSIRPKDEAAGLPAGLTATLHLATR